MPKSVLLTITSLVMGGAENQVVDVADELSARGYEVTLAYILKPALILPRCDKVKIVWLGGNRSFFGMMRAFANYINLIKRIRPDVVHSHMFHANILARIVRLVIRIPLLVCTAHNNNEGSDFRMLLYRITDPFADIFTNVSKDAVAVFEAKKAAPLGRMLVVHNGIDTSRYNLWREYGENLRIELGVSSCKVFIAVGRFHEAKDYPNLLNAFSILIAQEGNVHLLLVGDGELRPLLEKNICELGLQRRVTLLGIRKDIPELLSAADVFVLSSAWEGFGLVVAEAMAARRVVVATDCGGVAEVLGDAGFLVEPHNSKALAVAMLQSLSLTDEDSSALGNKARERVLARYSLRSAVDRWERIYSRELI